MSRLMTMAFSGRVPFAALLALAACDPSRSVSLDEMPERTETHATVSLSSYFPPSEAGGGWRKTTDPAQTRSLGLEPTKLDGLGSYLMALPTPG